MKLLSALMVYIFIFNLVEPAFAQNTVDHRIVEQNLDHGWEIEEDVVGPTPDSTGMMVMEENLLQALEPLLTAINSTCEGMFEYTSYEFKNPYQKAYGELSLIEFYMDDLKKSIPDHAPGLEFSLTEDQEKHLLCAPVKMNEIFVFARNTVLENKHCYAKELPDYSQCEDFYHTEGIFRRVAEVTLSRYSEAMTKMMVFSENFGELLAFNDASISGQFRMWNDFANFVLYHKMRQSLNLNSVLEVFEVNSQRTNKYDSTSDFFINSIRSIQKEMHLQGAFEGLDEITKQEVTIDDIDDYEDPEADRRNILGISLQSMQHAAYGVWSQLIRLWGPSYFYAWQREAPDHLLNKEQKEQKKEGAFFSYGKYKTPEQVAVDSICNTNPQDWDRPSLAFGWKNICRSSFVQYEGRQIKVKDYIKILFRQYHSQYLSQEAAEKRKKRRAAGHEPDIFEFDPSIHVLKKGGDNPKQAYEEDIQAFNNRVDTYNDLCHQVHIRRSKYKPFLKRDTQENIEEAIGPDLTTRFKEAYSSFMFEDNLARFSLGDVTFATHRNFSSYTDNLEKCAEDDEGLNYAPSPYDLKKAEIRIIRKQLQSFEKTYFYHHRALFNPEDMDFEEVQEYFLQYQPLPTLEYLLAHPSVNYSKILAKYINTYANEENWHVIERWVIFIISAIIIGGVIEFFTLGMGTPAVYAILALLAFTLGLYEVIRAPMRIMRFEQSNENIRESLVINAHYNIAGLLEQYEIQKTMLVWEHVFFTINAAALPFMALGAVKGVQGLHLSTLLNRANVLKNSGGASMQQYELLMQQIMRHPAYTTIPRNSGQGFVANFLRNKFGGNAGPPTIEAIVSGKVSSPVSTKDIARGNVPAAEKAPVNPYTPNATADKLKAPVKVNLGNQNNAGLKGGSPDAPGGEPVIVGDGTPTGPINSKPTGPGKINNPQRTTTQPQRRLHPERHQKESNPFKTKPDQNGNGIQNEATVIEKPNTKTTNPIDELLEDIGIYKQPNANPTHVTNVIKINLNAPSNLSISTIPSKQVTPFAAPVLANPDFLIDQATLEPANQPPLDIDINTPTTTDDETLEKDNEQGGVIVHQEIRMAPLPTEQFEINYEKYYKVGAYTQVHKLPNKVDLLGTYSNEDLIDHIGEEIDEETLKRIREEMDKIREDSDMNKSDIDKAKEVVTGTRIYTEDLADALQALLSGEYGDAWRKFAEQWLQRTQKDFRESKWKAVYNYALLLKQKEYFEQVDAIKKLIEQQKENTTILTPQELFKNMSYANTINLINDIPMLASTNQGVQRWLDLYKQNNSQHPYTILFDIGFPFSDAHTLHNDVSQKSKEVRDFVSKFLNGELNIIPKEIFWDLYMYASTNHEYKVPLAHKLGLELTDSGYARIPDENVVIFAQHFYNSFESDLGIFYMTQIMEYVHDIQAHIDLYRFTMWRRAGNLEALENYFGAQFTPELSEENIAAHDEKDSDIRKILHKDIDHAAKFNYFESLQTSVTNEKGTFNQVQIWDDFLYSIRWYINQDIAYYNNITDILFYIHLQPMDKKLRLANKLQSHLYIQYNMSLADARSHVQLLLDSGILGKPQKEEKSLHQQYLEFENKAYLEYANDFDLGFKTIVYTNYVKNILRSQKKKGPYEDLFKYLDENNIEYNKDYVNAVLLYVHNLNKPYLKKHKYDKLPDKKKKIVDSNLLQVRQYFIHVLGIPRSDAKKLVKALADARILGTEDDPTNNTAPYMDNFDALEEIIIRDPSSLLDPEVNRQIKNKQIVHVLKVLNGDAPASIDDFIPMKLILHSKQPGVPDILRYRIKLFFYVFYRNNLQNIYTDLLLNRSSITQDVVDYTKSKDGIERALHVRDMLEFLSETSEVTEDSIMPILNKALSLDSTKLSSLEYFLEKVRNHIESNNLPIQLYDRALYTLYIVYMENLHNPNQRSIQAGFDGLTVYFAELGMDINTVIDLLEYLHNQDVLNSADQLDQLWGPPTTKDSQDKQYFRVKNHQKNALIRYSNQYSTTIEDGYIPSLDEAQLDAYSLLTKLLTNKGQKAKIQEVTQVLYYLHSENLEIANGEDFKDIKKSEQNKILVNISDYRYYLIHILNLPEQEVNAVVRLLAESGVLGVDGSVSIEENEISHAINTILDKGLVNYDEVIVIDQSRRSKKANLEIMQRMDSKNFPSMKTRVDYIKNAKLLEDLPADTIEKSQFFQLLADTNEKRWIIFFRLNHHDDAHIKNFLFHHSVDRYKKLNSRKETVEPNQTQKPNGLQETTEKKTSTVAGRAETKISKPKAATAKTPKDSAKPIKKPKAPSPVNNQPEVTKNTEKTENTIEDPLQTKQGLRVENMVYQAFKSYGGTSYERMVMQNYLSQLNPERQQAYDDLINYLALYRNSYNEKDLNSLITYVHERNRSTMNGKYFEYLSYEDQRKVLTRLSDFKFFLVHHLGIPQYIAHLHVRAMANSGLLGTDENIFDLLPDDNAYEGDILGTTQSANRHFTNHVNTEDFINVFLYSLSIIKHPVANHFRIYDDIDDYDFLLDSIEFIQSEAGRQLADELAVTVDPKKIPDVFHAYHLPTYMYYANLTESQYKYAQVLREILGLKKNDFGQLTFKHTKRVFDAKHLSILQKSHGHDIDWSEVRKATSFIQAIDDILFIKNHYSNTKEFIEMLNGHFMKDLEEFKDTADVNELIKRYPIHANTYHLYYKSFGHHHEWPSSIEMLQELANEYNVSLDPILPGSSTYNKSEQVGDINLDPILAHKDFEIGDFTKITNYLNYPTAPSQKIIDLMNSFIFYFHGTKDPDIQNNPTYAEVYQQCKEALYFLSYQHIVSNEFNLKFNSVQYNNYNERNARKNLFYILKTHITPDLNDISISNLVKSFVEHFRIHIFRGADQHEDYPLQMHLWPKKTLQDIGKYFSGFRGGRQTFTVQNDIMQTHLYFLKDTDQDKYYFYIEPALKDIPGKYYPIEFLSYFPMLFTNLGLVGGKYPTQEDTHLKYMKVDENGELVLEDVLEHIMLLENQEALETTYRYNDMIETIAKDIWTDNEHLKAILEVVDFMANESSLSRQDAMILLMTAHTTGKKPADFEKMRGLANLIQMGSLHDVDADKLKEKIQALSDMGALGIQEELSADEKTHKQAVPPTNNDVTITADMIFTQNFNDKLNKIANTARIALEKDPSILSNEEIQAIETLSALRGTIVDEQLINHSHQWMKDHPDQLRAYRDIAKSLQSPLNINPLGIQMIPENELTTPLPSNIANIGHALNEAEAALFEKILQARLTSEMISKLPNTIHGNTGQTKAFTLDDGTNIFIRKSSDAGSNQSESDPYLTSLLLNISGEQYFIFVENPSSAKNNNSDGLAEQTHSSLNLELAKESIIIIAATHVQKQIESNDEFIPLSDDITWMVDHPSMYKKFVDVSHLYFSKQLDAKESPDGSIKDLRAYYLNELEPFIGIVNLDFIEPLLFVVHEIANKKENDGKPHQYKIDLIREAKALCKKLYPGLDNQWDELFSRLSKKGIEILGHRNEENQENEINDALNNPNLIHQNSNMHNGFVREIHRYRTKYPLTYMLFDRMLDQGIYNFGGSADFRQQVQFIFDLTSYRFNNIKVTSEDIHDLIHLFVQMEFNQQLSALDEVFINIRNYKTMEEVKDAVRAFIPKITYANGELATTLQRSWDEEHFFDLRLTKYLAGDEPDVEIRYNWDLQKLYYEQYEHELDVWLETLRQIEWKSAAYINQQPPVERTVYRIINPENPNGSILDSFQGADDKSPYYDRGIEIYTDLHGLEKWMADGEYEIYNIEAFSSSTLVPVELTYKNETINIFVSLNGRYRLEAEYKRDYQDTYLTQTRGDIDIETYGPALAQWSSQSTFPLILSFPASYIEDLMSDDYIHTTIKFNKAQTYRTFHLGKFLIQDIHRLDQRLSKNQPEAYQKFKKMIESIAPELIEEENFEQILRFHELAITQYETKEKYISSLVDFFSIGFSIGIPNEIAETFYTACFSHFGITRKALPPASEKTTSQQSNQTNKNKTITFEDVIEKFNTHPSRNDVTKAVEAILYENKVDGMYEQAIDNILALLFTFIEGDISSESHIENHLKEIFKNMGAYEFPETSFGYLVGFSMDFIRTLLSTSENTAANDEQLEKTIQSMVDASAQDMRFHVSESDVAMLEKLLELDEDENYVIEIIDLKMQQVPLHEEFYNTLESLYAIQKHDFPTSNKTFLEKQIKILLFTISNQQNETMGNEKLTRLMVAFFKHQHQIAELEPSIVGDIVNWMKLFIDAIVQQDSFDEQETFAQLQEEIDQTLATPGLPSSKETVRLYTKSDAKKVLKTFEAKFKASNREASFDKFYNSFITLPETMINDALQMINAINDRTSIFFDNSATPASLNDDNLTFMIAKAGKAESDTERSEIIRRWVQTYGQDTYTIFDKSDYNKKHAHYRQYLQLTDNRKDQLLARFHPTDTEIRYSNCTITYNEKEDTYDVTRFNKFGFEPVPIEQTIHYTLETDRMYLDLNGFVHLSIIDDNNQRLWLEFAHPKYTKTNALRALPFLDIDVEAPTPKEQKLQRIWLNMADDLKGFKGHEWFIDEMIVKLFIAYDLRHTSFMVPTQVKGIPGYHIEYFDAEVMLRTYLSTLVKDHQEYIGHAIQKIGEMGIIVNKSDIIESIHNRFANYINQVIDGENPNNEDPGTYFSNPVSNILKQMFIYNLYHINPSFLPALDTILESTFAKNEGVHFATVIRVYEAIAMKPVNTFNSYMYDIYHEIDSDSWAYRELENLLAQVLENGFKPSVLQNDVELEQAAIAEFYHGDALEDLVYHPEGPGEPIRENIKERAYIATQLINMLGKVVEDNTHIGGEITYNFDIDPQDQTVTFHLPQSEMKFYLAQIKKRNNVYWIPTVDGNDEKIMILDLQRFIGSQHFVIDENLFAATDVEKYEEGENPALQFYPNEKYLEDLQTRLSEATLEDIEFAPRNHLDQDAIKSYHDISTFDALSLDIQEHSKHPILSLYEIQRFINNKNGIGNALKATIPSPKYPAKDNISLTRNAYAQQLLRYVDYMSGMLPAPKKFYAVNVYKNTQLTKGKPNVTNLLPEIQDPNQLVYECYSSLTSEKFQELAEKNAEIVVIYTRQYAMMEKGGENDNNSVWLVAPTRTPLVRQTFDTVGKNHRVTYLHDESLLLPKNILEKPLED